MAEKSTAVADAALANGAHVANGSGPAGNGPVEKEEQSAVVGEESQDVVGEQQQEEDGDDDGAGDAEKFFTIFIGDDKTDEVRDTGIPG